MKIKQVSRLAGALGLCSLGVGVAVVYAQPDVRTTARTVEVGERDYKVTVSPRTLEAGVVRLVVRNTGKVPHVLAIGGPNVSKRTGLIRPGGRASVSVSLSNGTYTLWCPLPGHAARGMRATLRVSGGAVPPAPTPTSTDPQTTDVMTGYGY